MNDLIFVLGCVGLAHLFTHHYTPYLATGEGDRPPFAHWLLRLFGYNQGDHFAEPGLLGWVDWGKKPWSCWLCLSAWIALVLRVLWQVVDPPVSSLIFHCLFDPLFFGGVAWILAHWLDVLIRYYDSLSRV